MMMRVLWNLIVFDETIMFWEKGMASGKVIVNAGQDDAHYMGTAFCSCIPEGVEGLLLDDPLKGPKGKRESS